MNESTLVSREELSDLDWLARNVHVWPAGDYQPWCYVYMTHGGAMKAAGNFLDAVANPTMITKDQWLARRAELQNKPSWEDAPEWANWLAQDEDGEWWFFSARPKVQSSSFGEQCSGISVYYAKKGETLGDWRDTLEKRPEQEEFKPLTSIEDNQEKDMKQDNGWFERGDLPPVGLMCEIRHSCWNSEKYDKVTIVAITNEYLIVKYETLEQHYMLKDISFRPIPTEREVLADLIESQSQMSALVVADAILATGFSLRAK